MESTLPLILFLACLFIFTLAILATGYSRLERDRVERGLPTIAELFAPTPLLAPLDATPPGVEVPFDPGLVTRIERHLSSERAIASAFLCSPSPQILNERLARTPAPDEGWLEDLRGFLARERAAVLRFVSSPSVSLLYPEAAPGALRA